MRTRISLYLFLLISMVVQIILRKYLGWFPDLSLLMVVFVGIFFGWGEVVVFCLIAGVFRGSFSDSTFLIDIILFPAVGLICSALKNLFYKNNPVAQAFMTTAALTIVIGVHISYLNITDIGTMSILSVWRSSWKSIVMTIVLSPVIFLFLKEQTRVE